MTRRDRYLRAGLLVGERLDRDSFDAHDGIWDVRCRIQAVVGEEVELGKGIGTFEGGQFPLEGQFTPTTKTQHIDQRG